MARRFYRTSDLRVIAEAPNAKTAARILGRGQHAVRNFALTQGLGFGRRRVRWTPENLQLAAVDPQRAAQLLGCKLHAVHVALSKHRIAMQRAQG